MVKKINYYQNLKGKTISIDTKSGLAQQHNIKDVFKAEDGNVYIKTDEGENINISDSEGSKIIE